MRNPGSRVLPDHNGRFAEPPEHSDSAFVAATLAQCRNILCRQEERVVANDNTVSYHGVSLQLPPRPGRPHFVKARVRVHEYPDGALAVFHGPRRLADYTADGCLIGPQRMAA